MIRAFPVDDVSCDAGTQQKQKYTCKDQERVAALLFAQGSYDFRGGKAGEDGICQFFGTAEFTAHFLPGDGGMFLNIGAQIVFNIAKKTFPVGDVMRQGFREVF